jgi:hypothetical protein
MNAMDGYTQLDEAVKVKRAAISTLRPSALTARDFGTVMFDDVDLDPGPEWLVDGLLPEGGLSAVWGDPGCGKSFLVLRIALAIAAGELWHGLACTQGAVAYVAAEGGRGFKKRLLAHRKRFGVSRLPFALISAAVDLCSVDHETDALIAELQRLAQLSPTPLKLVVIDTLSRSMGGGNENGPEDMGALIRNADRIRQVTGAHVLFVHHGGKERDKKTRGHSSLYGALDTAIEVRVQELSGIRSAKVAKQKDGEDGAEFSFRLDVETVAVTADGEITSCIAVPVETEPSEDEPRSKRPTGVNAIALDALRRAVAEHGAVPPACNYIPPGTPAVSPALWRKFFYAVRGGESAESNKKAFKRASTDLQVKGLVGSWGEFSWPIS